MVRQNTFSYITKSFLHLELYQIQEKERALLNYNIINTSKRPVKVFQIIHSTEYIWINFPVLREKTTRIPGFWWGKLHVSVPFNNNENI